MLIEHEYDFYLKRAFIDWLRHAFAVCAQRLTILQAPGEEGGEYAPHLYAEEGHSDSSPQLEPIPVQEAPFHPDMLQDLDTKFNTLASLCSPEGTSS